MNNFSSSLIGGITGALALNILHLTYQQLDHDSPRVDLIGEEGISKLTEKAGGTPAAGKTLFAVTLAADLISNAAYYSLLGFSKKQRLIVAGVATGLAAGIGALTLTRPLGLRDAPVTPTGKTKILTIAWYSFGGLLAASVTKTLRG